MTTEHDYERVFREAGPGLWRALYAFTGGRRDVAEDAMAEAFARAIGHRGIREPVAWIHRTAFRLALQDLRRERDRRGEAEAAVEQVPPELQDLLRALRRLSPNQRAVVVLRFEADLDVPEIARRLGIAAPTVRVHLHRARKRLRALMSEEEERV